MTTPIMVPHNQENFIVIYSATAHVFKLNPSPKPNWIAKADHAIPIALLATTGSDRRQFKLIATDDNNIEVFEEFIQADAQFVPRSDKFCQWTHHGRVVCGLGFDQELDVTKFLDFVKELLVEISSQQSVSVSTTSLDQADGSQILMQDKPYWEQQMLEQQHHQQFQQQQQQTKQSPQQITNVSETNGRCQLNNTTGLQQYSNTLAHPGHLRQSLRRSQKTDTNMDNGHTNAPSMVNGFSQGGMPNAYPRSHSMGTLQSNKNQIIPTSSGNHTDSNNISLHNNSDPNNNNITLNHDNVSITTGRLSQDDSSIVSDWHIKELRYENERLKLALEEASKNCELWQSELRTVTTNNKKLTQALQESKAHVGEWDRELLALRNENQSLKVRIANMEPSNGLGRNVSELIKDGETKDNRIHQLETQLQSMTIKLKDFDELQTFKASNDINHHKKKLEIVSAKLEAKILDLTNMNKELITVIDNIDLK